MNKNIEKNIKYKKNIVISLFFYVIMILVNYLGGAGYINNSSQGDVSRSFTTMITPAGYAFSIWGLIYLLLLIAILSPLFTKNKLNIERINEISVDFWISCILNIAWIFAFSYRLIGFSTIIILCLLLSLWGIIMKLDLVSEKKKSFFDLAFGLYAGWVSIASLLNFSLFLVSIEFDFWNNAKSFYLLALILFILFTSFLQKVHNNPFYNLAIIWAFIAIISRLNFINYMDSMFLVLALGSLILFFVDFIFTLRSTEFKI